MTASPAVEKLVKQLYDAFNYPGALGFGATDEEAVYAAFKEAGEKGIMLAVETRYNALYEKEELSLRDELDDEFSGDELDKAVHLYNEAKKPKSNQAATDAPTTAPKAPAPRNSRCDATLVPKVGQEHPKCDPGVNVKLKTQGYGISVSPESKLNACQIVQMIKRNQKLLPWMRDMFAVNSLGNRICIKAGYKAPNEADWPEWFSGLFYALEPKTVKVPPEWKGTGYLKNWHVTTGVANVHKGDLPVRDRLRGDYEPGDAPSGAGGSKASSSIIAGLTFENKNYQPGLYDILENAAGGTTRGKAPHYRLPEILNESRRPEGLIVFADRYCRKDGSDVRIRVNEDAILETLFHELSAHAGQMTMAKSSDHGFIDFHVPDGDREKLITNTDKLSWDIWKFFGKADESCLIQELR
jgi:hypothetical protein